MLALVALMACKGGDGDSGAGNGGGGDEIPALYINEFLASNATGLTDESGAFPDWVELYNDGGQEQSLEGMYITDDLSVPTLWPFPAALSVPAKGYLVLYADQDTVDGDLHLPFALDEAGEQLGLYVDGDGGPVQVDAISYGAQTTDISEARVPDASENWAAASRPTPGASNGT